jgi:integrase
MGGGLVLLEAPAGQLAELEAMDERLAYLLEHSMSENTIRAYADDWRHFTTWCEGHGFASLPASPHTVARYLQAHADVHKPSTLTRRVSAISARHEAAGHDSPTHAAIVRKTLAGIRREKGTAPDTKSAITMDDLRAIMPMLPDGLRGTRDRALLLVGMAGAFRRSELAGIDCEHVTFVDEGARILLPRGKTDQEGQGRTVGIPFGTNPDTCPVRALKTWIGAAGITAGPVFRRVDRHGNVGADRLTGKSIAVTVKHYMGAIGKDAKAYSGHSMRAGHVTAAARVGVLSRDIMRTTGHKSEAMLARYIRDASLFTNNSAAALGF